MYKILLSPYSKIFYNEWKLDQNRSDYNIVFDQSFQGVIDISRLNDALKRFVSDYVLLNSHVTEENGELYWVKNKILYELECFKGNFSNQDILTYIQAPFDLTKGPLYRFAVIKRKINKYRFIIVFHHIIIDGSSFDDLIDEVSNYYNLKNYVTSIPIKDQLLNLEYLSDKLYKSLKFNQEKNQLFWKRQLVNIEPLDLGFFRINSNSNSSKNFKHKLSVSVQELSGINEIRFNFNKETLIKLNKLSLSPYLYGQSIYALLLHKYTQQNKFGLSYPISIKEGIGLVYGAHVNINVMPYNFAEVNDIYDIISQSKRFIKLLKQPSGISHGYLPIPSIISVSNKDLLNFSFVQTNFKDKLFKFKNVINNIRHSTNIDLLNELVFEHEIRDNIIKYRVKYRFNRISPILLKEFIKCYKRLFTNVLDELSVEDLNTKLRYIKTYNLLSNKKYRELINLLNNTSKDYDGDKTIHELFEEQVERSPDSIAVVCGDVRLSYRELNARANGLAHYLVNSYKVSPGTLVVLCLDRSEHMLIGILGVLKAGGAYVPIDPGYPE